MNKSKSILVDYVNLNKYKVLAIAVFCLLEFLLVNASSNLSSVLAVTAIALSFPWDKNVSMALYVCTSLYKLELGTFGNAVVYLIVAVVSLSAFNNRTIPYFDKFKTMVALFAVSILLTHIVGINSSIVTTISIFVKWMAAIYIAFMVINDKGGYYLVSLFCAGLGLLVYQLVNPVNALYFMEDDLLYNSKDIATAVAIPAYLLVWIVLNKKMRFLNLVFLIVLLILCVMTIVLTYSRGVLIALFLSVAYLILTSKSKYRFWSLLLMTIIVVPFYLTQDTYVDYERMTSNLEGGNGRTDIWLNFIENMKDEGPLRILFGFGPNGLTQITLKGTYAHSAILDYFFSFGVFGILFLGTVLITIIVKLVKNKDRLYMGLFILSFMMYLPHGNCAESHFIILIGMCMGAACLPVSNNTIYQN